MPKYVRLGREIDEIEQGNCVWLLTDPLIITPCFSWVLTTAWDNLKRFSGFLSVKEETAKRL